MLIEKITGPDLFNIVVNDEESVRVILLVQEILSVYKINHFDCAMIQSSTDRLLERRDCFEQMTIKCRKHAKRTILKWLDKVKHEEFKTILTEDLAVLYSVTTKTPLQVMRIELHNIECLVCHKVMERGKKCMRCKFAVYCSEKCQRHDWINGHKSECQLTPALPRFSNIGQSIVPKAEMDRFLEQYCSDLYKYM